MAVPERYAAYEAAWEYAVEVTFHRRLQDPLAKRQMIEVAERYDNAIVYPLDDVEGEPDFPAIAAQIIADSIDGFATRANDTCPVITAPAVNFEASNHRRRAELRKQAWGATYHESQLDLKMGRGYRQLFGYGTYSFFVEPDHAVHRARVQTRDPMLTYPEPMDNDEIRRPQDIAFVYGRSPEWLKRVYPECARHIDENTAADDDLWDILEWQDNRQCLIGILGKRSVTSALRRNTTPGQAVYGDYAMDQSLLLRAYPNRADIVTAVCPQGVTLNRMVSAISRIVPHTDVLNKLSALNYISAEKGVFPHIFVLSEPNQEADVLGGTIKDGRTGEANVLSGARAVQTLPIGPSPQIQVQMSDLERAARLSSGNPAVFQGEGSGSIRSGQTVSQLAGYSVDPRLREAHAVMSYALALVNESIAAIELGYWPGRKYVVFSGWQGANHHVSYTPTDIWTESKASVVEYPLPGMDAQNATVAISSLNQSRMLSRRTGMRLHPLVRDPEAEERGMIEESFDDAVVMAGVNLVAQGTLAWTDMANVRKYLRQGMLLEEAIGKAQKDAQERQATEAPPVQPGQAAAPEAMPGLNAPEAGGQMAAPPGAGGPPPGNAEQFEQVMAALMGAPPGGGGPGGAAPMGAPV